MKPFNEIFFNLKHRLRQKKRKGKERKGKERKGKERKEKKKQNTS
jgi:hypothetical protein